MDEDDWSHLRRVLRDAGVRGVHDLGTFVNDTTYLRPPSFDERAAFPILVEALAWLDDPKLVASVAGHLRRRWARPAAFGALLAAFRRWAPSGGTEPGWALGDALVNASTGEHLDALLAVGGDPSFGSARQMVVFGLWRFRADARVEHALRELVPDPTVALHAMTALRRVIGPLAMRPVLEDTARSADLEVAGAARRELRKVERILARQDRPARSPSAG